MNKVQNEKTSPKSKRHLSATQLNMFLRCPRQYEFRYLQGLKIPPSGAMVQSKAWHAALEANYTQKIKSDKDLPLSNMEELFSTRLDDAFREEEIKLSAKEDPGSLKDNGVLIVAEHHKVIAPTVKPAEVEQEFRVSLGEDFPYELLGYWDLIDRSGVIVDNKAYSRTPSQDDVDKDLQLTVYSLGYRVSKNAVEDSLRLDTVIKKKKPTAVQLVTKRTNDDCQWLLTLIEQVAKAIQSGVFYPNPNGWHCSPKFCGYWEKCKGNL